MSPRLAGWLAGWARSQTPPSRSANPARSHPTPLRAGAAAPDAGRGERTPSTLPPCGHAGPAPHGGGGGAAGPRQPFPHPRSGPPGSAIARPPESWPGPLTDGELRATPRSFHSRCPLPRLRLRRLHSGQESPARRPQTAGPGTRPTAPPPRGPLRSPAVTQPPPLRPLGGWRRVDTPAPPLPPGHARPEFGQRWACVGLVRPAAHQPHLFASSSCHWRQGQRVEIPRAL